VFVGWGGGCVLRLGKEGFSKNSGGGREILAKFFAKIHLEG
jgi:hypothetical protein